MATCLSAIIAWERIFEIFLGAVLAFVSSIIVGVLSKQIGAHRFLKKLKQELKSNYITILNNLETENRFIIISPIWDYILKSDVTLTFSANKYAKIIKIYVAIEALRRSESSSNPLNALVECRKQFIKVIDENKL